MAHAQRRMNENRYSRTKEDILTGTPQLNKMNVWEHLKHDLCWTHSNITVSRFIMKTMLLFFYGHFQGHWWTEFKCMDSWFDFCLFLHRQNSAIALNLFSGTFPGDNIMMHQTSSRTKTFWQDYWQGLSENDDIWICSSTQNSLLSPLFYFRVIFHLIV